jgi:hypothetical protein
LLLPSQQVLLIQVAEEEDQQREMHKLLLQLLLPRLQQQLLRNFAKRQYGLGSLLEEEVYLRGRTSDERQFLNRM